MLCLRSSQRQTDVDRSGFTAILVICTFPIHWLMCHTPIFVFVNVLFGWMVEALRNVRWLGSSDVFGGCSIGAFAPFMMRSERNEQLERVLYRRVRGGELRGNRFAPLLPSPPRSVFIESFFMLCSRRSLVKHSRKKSAREDEKAFVCLLVLPIAYSRRKCTGGIIVS